MLLLLLIGDDGFVRNFRGKEQIEISNMLMCTRALIYVMLCVWSISDVCVGVFSFAPFGGSVMTHELSLVM